MWFLKRDFKEPGNRVPACTLFIFRLSRNKEAVDRLQPSRQVNLQELNLHPVDLLVVVSYLGAMLAIGVLHRRQDTPQNYFLAGRSVSGLLAGISMTVALFSAVSFMGGISFYFANDLRLLAGLLGIAPCVFLINRFMLPHYRQTAISTSYEYLERRFDPTARSLASLLFILLRMFYLGVVIYAPSVALTLVTGWSLQATVMVIGFTSIGLASIGGMRAILWSELIKFSALVISLVSILCTLLLRIEGGLSTIWAIAEKEGKLRLFDFSLDPTVTFAFWGVFCGTLVEQLNSHATDQVAVQRLLIARSTREARWVNRFSIVAIVGFNLLIALIGLGIFAYYRQPSRLSAQLENTDYLLPFFAIRELPLGVTGIVIATIFSTSLTTHSSVLHSINTVFMNDFVRRYWRSDLSSKQELKWSRCSAFVLGMLTLVAALLVPRLGIMMIASKKLNQFFGGVLLAVFLLGMISSKARSKDAMAGAGVGLATVTVIGIATPISFFWYAPIGCAVTLLVASTLAHFQSRRNGQHSDQPKQLAQLEEPTE